MQSPAGCRSEERDLIARSSWARNRTVRVRTDGRPGRRCGIAAALWPGRFCRCCCSGGRFAQDTATAIASDSPTPPCATFRPGFLNKQRLVAPNHRRGTRLRNCPRQPPLPLIVRGTCPNPVRHERRTQSLSRSARSGRVGRWHAGKLCTGTCLAVRHPGSRPAGAAAAVCAVKRSGSQHFA